MTNIAIFASGAGTNAVNIIRYFERSETIRVSLIISENPHAPVLLKAATEGIKTAFITREQIKACQPLLDILNARSIDYIVLAGFLTLLPAGLIEAYRGRIVNIHPSLLPLYGGKGMYGEKVHKAVIEAGEKQSGITIHTVTEEYDRGTILEQVPVKVTASDTPETLAQKIHALEYEYYPKTIERHINLRFK